MSEVPRIQPGSPVPPTHPLRPSREAPRDPRRPRPEGRPRRRRELESDPESEGPAPEQDGRPTAPTDEGSQTGADAGESSEVESPARAGRIDLRV